MKVERVCLRVFWATFSLPFYRSPLQSRMVNEPSSSLTEHGPQRGPLAQRSKSALGSVQVIRSISSELLPYPQSDLSCDLYLKQLMKTVPYVKLHFIQFSPSWKLTLKMFCLSEHFPLWIKGLMMYNPSWRFYGRASQSKHFPPLFYITLTNRNAEPFNYKACLTHPESQILWWHLAEGEKCAEFPELLVKRMTPRKPVNDLEGPVVSATLYQSAPRGSESAPLALQHLIPWRFRMSRQEMTGKEGGKTKVQPQPRTPGAGLSFTETFRCRACTLNSLTHKKESAQMQLNSPPSNFKVCVTNGPRPMCECTKLLCPVLFQSSNT